MASIFRKMKSVVGLDNKASDCAQFYTSQQKKSLFTFAGIFCAFMTTGVVNAQSVDQASVERLKQEQVAYKAGQARDSEFDNASDAFGLYWQDASEDYQDTVFGELAYNEPSTPTKLEMLRLLSKETPSLIVFMHAVSMGLGIDDILLASLEYEPERARDLASAAVNLLPLVSDTEVYRYSTYDLGELTKYVDGQIEERNKGYVRKGDEHNPYSIQEVVDKFFEDRLVLAPYPDWADGQFHFMASAKELLSYQNENVGQRWFYSKSSKPVDDRSIFISLYEHNKTVLIDGLERIEFALEQNQEAQLPVVFVYNRLNERSVDNLGYPATLRGLRDAYTEKNLMLTPAPEWEKGEYHISAKIDEFDEFFDLPEETDFEPEAWEALLAEAENYDVNDTSILLIVLGSHGGSDKKKESETIGSNLFTNTTFAAWDNPRTESKYKYTAPKGSVVPSLNGIIGNGMVVNRPDLLSALKALGVAQVPVTAYYLDSARVKPYSRGPRSLIQAALGLNTPTIVPPGGGVLPPPVDLPPASPPGL